MGKKSIRVKECNVAGGSGGDTLYYESVLYVLINDDDGCPSSSVSYRLFQTNPARRSKSTGKQPIKPTRRKTRAKNPKTKLPSPVNIHRSPCASPFESCKPHSLGGRRATLDDLNKIRVKYNIPSWVQLRVLCKGERSDHPKSDDIARHIDLFNLGLRLPL